MPCRSSRASISLRPRDSFVRSRLPSGASGGIAGFDARGAGAAANGLADGADLATGAAGEGSVRGAACTFVARYFLSGLTCFATSSQRSRSSSLSARRRAEGRGGSSTGGRDDRFIAGGNDFSGDGAVRGQALSRDAAPARAQGWRRRRFRSCLAPKPQQEWPAWRDRFAETALRSSPTAADPAPAAFGR